MDIDNKIERRLKVLDQCIKEAFEILLEAYSEKSLISHLFYMKQDDETAKILTDS